MAKAKRIKELDCTADAREWAEKVLHVRITEVIALKDRALDFSDIEGVHDMRVAARRLRSALRDFAPLASKGPLKKASSDLKKLADTLGNVRDHDVAIIALEKLQTTAPGESVRAGLIKLSARLGAQRDDERRHLEKVLGSKNFAGLRGRFQKSLEKAFDKKPKQDPISFNQAGRAAVAGGLEDFLNLHAALYYPSANAGLHRLRIAAKRLRYALELFVACWGDKIAPFADEISKMQSHLGEIHDCDIWIENLGTDLEHGATDWSTNGVERAAAVWLLSEFSRKRSAEYLAALGIWSDSEREDFVPRMRAAISASPEPL